MDKGLWSDPLVYGWRWNYAREAVGLVLQGPKLENQKAKNEAIVLTLFLPL